MKKSIFALSALTLVLGANVSKAEDLISKFSNQQSVVHCPVNNCTEISITSIAITVTVAVAKRMEEVRPDAMAFIALDSNLRSEKDASLALLSVVDELINEANLQGKTLSFEDAVNSIVEL
ncbi:MAG: hypothetical protein AB7I27_02705 [Bacteriovoracaceae bacterium]